MRMGEGVRLKDLLQRLRREDLGQSDGNKVGGKELRPGAGLAICCGKKMHEPRRRVGI